MSKCICLKLVGQISCIKLLAGTRNIFTQKEESKQYCPPVEYTSLSRFLVGVPAAQWVKHWPPDLAFVSSSPARGEIISTVNEVSIAHSFSLSSTHHPDMTELLLKKM